MKRPRFRIRVRATDRGTPELYADVDVELDVVDRNNRPPVWDQQSYGPIYVKENAPQGKIVTTVRARFVYKTICNKNIYCFYLPIDYPKIKLITRIFGIIFSFGMNTFMVLLVDKQCSFLTTTIRLNDT